MAPAGLTARTPRLPRYGPTAASQCSATRAPATRGTSRGVLPSQQPTRAFTRSSRKEPGAALRATQSWSGASSPRHQFAVTDRRPRPSWDGAFCCAPEQPFPRPLKPERAGTKALRRVAATLIRSLAKGILTQPSCARAASQGQPARHAGASLVPRGLRFPRDRQSQRHRCRWSFQREATFKASGDWGRLFDHCGGHK
jgi:hypothetical protein